MTNNKLADALSSAVIQMDMAGDCIEAGRYDEALLHVRSMMRSRREALAEHDAQHAPRGWRLVPILATPEMDAAGKRALSDNGVDDVDDSDALVTYHAMLAAAPQPAPAPVQVGGLEGDARLAHDQCRAVAQMARALAEVHDARMSILATGRAPVEVIGQSSAEIMEWLGDALSGMDACDESDEWMDPVFDAAQARWPIAAHPPAPAADGAGELPPLPEPTCLGFRNPCGITQLPDMGIYGYTADQVRACQREAIAALRQPVPDAVREEVVGAIAKPATGWDVAGNYGDGKWRAFRLEKQQTYLGDPKSSEMEAIAETHRLAALAALRESRNGSEGEGK